MTDTAAESGRRTHKRPTKPAAPDSTAAGPQPSLRIIDTRVLLGPNLWARVPVINMHVDLGVLEDWPSNRIDGFTTALSITVGSLLLASPPQAQPNPCSSAKRANSGIASIGNCAPELNSISIFMSYRSRRGPC